MKSSFALIAVLVFGVAAGSSGADGDAPKLIQSPAPSAIRTTNGIRFTATWKPNSTAVDVKARFIVTDDSSNQTTLKAVPFVIRGLGKVTVTTEFTGLTRGMEYTWRAVAGQVNGGPITNGDEDPTPITATVPPGLYQGPVLDDSAAEKGTCAITVGSGGTLTGKLKVFGYSKMLVNSAFDSSGLSKGNVFRTTSGATFSAVFTSDPDFDIIHVHIKSASEGINWKFDIEK